jgi:TfoX/Sxy family transcriptional regulator of competence genes
VTADASDYRARLAALLEGVRPRLVDPNSLTFKNVFGAVASYEKGCIFASCSAFGVALRLPLQALERVLAQDSEGPLRYFQKGHVKKQYAVLPQRLLDDGARFQSLVDESVAYVMR